MRPGRLSLLAITLLVLALGCCCCSVAAAAAVEIGAQLGPAPEAAAEAADGGSNSGDPEQGAAKIRVARWDWLKNTFFPSKEPSAEPAPSTNEVSREKAPSEVSPGAASEAPPPAVVAPAAAAPAAPGSQPAPAPQPAAEDGKPLVSDPHGGAAATGGGGGTQQVQHGGTADTMYTPPIVEIPLLIIGNGGANGTAGNGTGAVTTASPDANSTISQWTLEPALNVTSDDDGELIEAVAKEEEEEQKGKMLFIIIGAGAALFLLLTIGGGVGYYFYRKKKKGPKREELRAANGLTIIRKKGEPDRYVIKAADFIDRGALVHTKIDKELIRDGKHELDGQTDGDKIPELIFDKNLNEVYYIGKHVEIHEDDSVSVSTGGKLDVSLTDFDDKKKSEKSAIVDEKNKPADKAASVNAEVSKGPNAVNKPPASVNAEVSKGPNAVNKPPVVTPSKVNAVMEKPVVKKGK